MYVYEKDLIDSREFVNRWGSKKYPGTCNAGLRLDAGDNFIGFVNKLSHLTGSALVPYSMGHI